MSESHTRTCSSRSETVLAKGKGKRKRVSSEPTKKLGRPLPDLNDPGLPDLNKSPPPDTSDDEEQSSSVADNKLSRVDNEGSTATAATSRKREIGGESESSSNWVKAKWKKFQNWIW